MEKRVPKRMCVTCRKMFEKAELTRIVKNKDGSIILDETFKEPGRGAYICNNENCLARVMKERRFERALSAQIPAQVYERLAEVKQRGVND